MPTVRLTWTDPNSGAAQEDEIRVYRDTAPFDAETLPAVLDTLAADEVTYDDTTALSGTSYWYAVAMVKDGVEKLAFTTEVEIIGVGGLSYSVLVPSGTVGSNLTGFPVPIDLSMMPSSFWSNVRSDGGNLRAYMPDGTTLIPIDVTYIHTGRELGRAVVRRDLLAASDTEIILTLLDPATTGLGVTDTNGRNAVWAGYEVVIMYPETVNRTGDVYTRYTGEVAFSEWKRTDYFDMTGNPHQGLAVDTSGNLVTIDTNYLRRSTQSAVNTVLASNSDPVGAVKTATGNTNLNHLSDGCIIAGELWVPCNEYPVVSSHDEYLCVFNLTTLALDRFYNVSAQSRHHSSLCYRADIGEIIATDYNNGASLLRYNTSGTYLGAITLSSTINKPQGIEVVEGVFYISAEDFTINAPIYEVAFDGTRLGTVFINPQGGDNEGISYNPTTKVLYHMDGDGDMTVLQKVDAIADWSRLHYDQHWETYPRSTVWSMGASVHWLYLTGDLQQGFLSMANGATSSQRATAAYRGATNRLALWNSTDSWVESDIDLAYKSQFRLGVQHDGTTQRRLFYNGILKATDNTISARPTGSGSNMDFVINASDTSAGEEGEAYYQYLWARNDYVSADWMAADALVMNSPASFYTITEL